MIFDRNKGFENKYDLGYDPLSAEIDRVWAGNSSDQYNKFSNYYDYYFSGEDVKVFIDGLFDPEDELDVLSFAYSVSQQKQPVYGFWSYNYDAMMYGTRIISGEFTIYARHPRRMTEFLEKAARNREASAKDMADGRRSAIVKDKDRVISRLSRDGFSSQDEKNIQKFWAYSQLDRVTYEKTSESNNIFSAHPPFNFVILYGVEETALTPYSAAMSNEVVISDNLDRMIYSDVNQRTVRADNVGSSMKTILQQVNLMNMSVGYSPGGRPLVESYQFIARDFYHSSVDLTFIKGMVTSNESDVDIDIAGNGLPPRTTSFNNPPRF